jgi:hypothetical protein
VTLNGTVVGIPTLEASASQSGGSAQGIGFAVPSNRVTYIAQQIIATGHVEHTGRAYREQGDVAYCVLASAPRAKSVAGSLKSCFAARFQGVLDSCLKASVRHGWDAQWTHFAMCLRDVHPFCRFGSPGLEGHHKINQPSPSFR